MRRFLRNVKMFNKGLGRMLWKSFVEHLDIAQKAAHAWISTREVFETDRDCVEGEIGGYYLAGRSQGGMCSDLTE